MGVALITDVCIVAAIAMLLILIFAVRPNSEGGEGDSDPIADIIGQSTNLTDVDEVLTLVYKSLAIETRAMVVKLRDEVALLKQFRQSFGIVLAVVGLVLALVAVYLGFVGPLLH